MKLSNPKPSPWNKALPGAGVALLGLAILVLAYGRLRADSALSERGVRAEATVDGVYGGKTSGSWYSFRVNGVAYIGQSPVTHVVGRKILVTYLPSDPQVSQELGTASARWYVLIGTAVGAIGVAMGTSAYRAARRGPRPEA